MEQLIDPDGTLRGRHIRTEADSSGEGMDVLMFTTGGWTRSLDASTNTGRWARPETFPDLEVVDTYFHDIPNYSDVIDTVKAMIANGSTDIQIYMYLLDVSGSGTYGFSRHECADPSVCTACIAQEEETQAEYDRLSDGWEDEV